MTNISRTSVESQTHAQSRSQPLQRHLVTARLLQRAREGPWRALYGPAERRVTESRRKALNASGEPLAR